MSIWGNPVTAGGGGGLPLMTRGEWNALSLAEKQACGLLAIRDADTGYHRGEVVCGQDYRAFEIVQSGTAASSGTFAVTAGGDYSLYVVALNSEASTYNLNIAASCNGAALTGETLEYNPYYASGANRRNYRIMRFAVTAEAGDSIRIDLSGRSNYSSFVYALAFSSFTVLGKTLSTADAVCSGSYGASGAVLYGTFAGAGGGTVNASLYTAGSTVTTANPGSNYKSAYIFWFAEAAP